MKIVTTLVLALSLGTLAIVNAPAQGRINFANSSRTPIGIGSPFTGYVVLGTASTAQFGIGPASVQVSLMAGLTSSSLSPVLIGTAANAPFVLNTASTIAAAQGTFPGGSNLVLPGFDGSAPVFLQLQLRSVIPFLYEGYSPIISVIPATGVDLATPLFSATANPDAWDPLDGWGSLGGVSLRIGVPEPSSGALLALGACVLAGFRSRKRPDRKLTQN